MSKLAIMYERSRGLKRFKEQHTKYYRQAVAELADGKKRTHWIWYIFPQAKGLGTSRNSQVFGLTQREARAYRNDPFLWYNTYQCFTWVRYHCFRGKSLEEIMGDLDATKFRSFIELFAPLDPQVDMFYRLFRV